METLLTASLELITIGFTLIMAFDFINGLLHLFRTSAPLAIAQTELQLEQAIAPQIELAITASTQSEPQLQVVPGWDLIEPVGPEVATLDWIEQNMPPAEVWVTEMPDVIALIKVRQPQAQPPVARFEQAATNQCRYPQVQKACSSLQIHRYNTMRLAELAAVLEGKVAVSELIV